MTLKPSTAPRWKIAMSCFARPLPCAYAVRARNDGAKPRLTRANAPFFRKTRRDVIASQPLCPLWWRALSPLELRLSQLHAVGLRIRDDDATQLVAGERQPEVHAADECAGVHPRVGC